MEQNNIKPSITLRVYTIQHYKKDNCHNGIHIWNLAQHPSFLTSTDEVCVYYYCFKMTSSAYNKI